MKTGKGMRLAGLILCLCGLGIGVFANFMVATAPRYPYTMEETAEKARVDFAAHAEKLDAILDTHHLPPAEWEEELSQYGFDLRKIVTLENGEIPNLVLCADPGYAPWFRIYFTGKRLDKPQDFQLVCEEYPWMWELIDAVGQGRVTQRRFEAICQSQRKEIFKELSNTDKADWADDSAYAFDKEFYVGFISVGSVESAVVAEYSEEDDLHTGYYHTNVNVHMYLY